MNSENQEPQCSPDRVDSAQPGEQPRTRKLPYAKPKLTYHGDLRSLTLFGSFDSKDSGLGSDLINP